MPVVLCDWWRHYAGHFAAQQPALQELVRLWGTEHKGGCGLLQSTMEALAGLKGPLGQVLASITECVRPQFETQPPTASATECNHPIMLPVMHAHKSLHDYIKDA